MLVVDDDEMMLRILGPRMRELKLPWPIGHVETASTPEAALEKVDGARSAPLLVVSDFNLRASMNGIQLLVEIARRRADAVRVLISGYAADQIGDVHGGGAVHGFIEKPMRIGDMLPPLERIVRNAFNDAARR